MLLFSKFTSYLANCCHKFSNIQLAGIYFVQSRTFLFPGENDYHFFRCFPLFLLCTVS